MNPLDTALSHGYMAAEEGFDWEDPLLALDKVREELDELSEALQSGDELGVREEMGDLLFSIVQVARLAEVDAGEALAQANDKFLDRYEGMKKIVGNQEFAELSLSEQMALWQRVKEDRIL